MSGRKKTTSSNHENNFFFKDSFLSESSFIFAVLFSLTTDGQNQESSVIDSKIKKIIGTFHEELNPEEVASLYITTDQGKLRGWFYGTSDEFDHAREGYYCGFFVSEIQDIQINGDTITFQLTIGPDKCFESPVSLQYRSAEEVRNSGQKQWVQQGVPSQTVHYRGLFKQKGTIQLSNLFFEHTDPLLFIKKEQPTLTL